MCRTEAEWAATSIALNARQLGYNTTTGELRLGPGLWHKCTPLGVRPNTEVKAATTGNITISTGLNAGDAVDGVTLVAGDLVLVKNQNTASQNGVYVAGESPARATAYDSWGEMLFKLVRVTDGETNKNKHFRCNVAPGGTLGTTDIGWDEEPVGFLNFGNPTAISVLPQRFKASVDPSCALLLFDPTNNQLATITISELALYLGI